MPHRPRLPILRALLVLALLGAAALAPALAAPAALFTDDRDHVEVPFRFERNKIVVEVRVNGDGPFDFVLDTGASHAYFFDGQAASRLTLKNAGEAQVQGAGGGGGMSLPLASDVVFDFGGVQLRENIMAVQPTDRPSPLPGAPWHGVFGRQVFDRLVVEIDWKKEVLRLHDPKSYRAPADAASLPIKLRHGHSFVTAEVVTQGKAPQPVELVIDTGASHALSLAEDPANDNGARRIEGAHLGRGLGGVIRGDFGRLQELRLGRYTLPGVIVDFPEAKFVPVLTSGRDGNLGAEVLRRFTVTFDYSQRRMLLVANDDFDAPFPFSTSGLKATPWLTDEGHAEVDDILAGSPAARAGIQVGDRLIRVDGQTIAELGFDRVRELLRQPPGTEIRLELQRGETRRNVTLELEQLL